MSKPNETKGFWKELASIFILFLLLDLLIFLSLRWHYNRRFSPEKMQEIITANSKFKEVTDDPCKWAVMGDPLATDNSYIKISVNCPGNIESSNTLDLRGVKGETFVDLLDNYSRIQGIDNLIIDEGVITGWGKLVNTDNSQWTCFVNRKEVAEIDVRYKPRDWIQCFYADADKLREVRAEFSKMKI